MRIILSFLRMVGFGGTETYTLTVAAELERLGHDVLIYAPQTGPSADFARGRGARIVERESELPDACDLVLSQDASTAYAMASRYPSTTRVFVAHAPLFPLQSPPQIEDVCHAVVVMSDRLRRRTEALGRELPVIRLRQPIDLQRFCFQTLNLTQRRPPRVLVLSHYTRGTRARMIERACALAGLELAQFGATSTITPTPELAIAQSEIVISLGRGALEAMAGGRGAYVFGDAGGDGWVTAKNYAALEADGFSGRAFGEPIDAERMARDLASWDEAIGEAGRDLACAHHDVQDHAVRLVALAAELEPSPARGPDVADELARLIRLEWEHNSRVRAAVIEIENARSESDALRDRVTELEAVLERVQADLAELRDTRRVRLACLMATPLDRLRAGRAPRA